MTPHCYYVILAGGSGTRLWPLSRNTFPKHLLDLRGDGSMLQETVARILPLTTPDHIFIITEQSHSDLITKQLPHLPLENIIIEPARRETGPCIALAALTIALRDPEAIMVSLHSDHFIKDEEKFRQTLRAATILAEKTNLLITLGIHPTYPETGYGYIESEAQLDSYKESTLFAVKRFTEKPDQPTAQAFITAGTYFWNSGIFIWKTSCILHEIEKANPEFYRLLQDLKTTLVAGKPIAESYLALPKKAIEYLVIEKSKHVATIPVDFGWSDIGSFQAVKDMLTSYPEENLERGEHITLGSHGCLIYSPQKLVATIGLEDMIIVETDDILLVCPKNRSQEVKKLVQQLKDMHKEHYL